METRPPVNKTASAYAAEDEDTQNKKFVQYLMDELFNKGNTKIVSETTLGGFVYQGPANSALPPNADGYVKIVNTLRDAFPDLKLKFDEVSTSNGRVVTQWTIQGKHTGVLHGFPINSSLRLEPTNKVITITGNSIDHVDYVKVDSVRVPRITKHRDYVDWLGLLQQLGAIRISGQDDNLRASANIAVSLGTQLIGVALAVLAVQGAFFTFILDKRTPSDLFYITVLATFLLLFGSIIVGALYVNNVKIMLFKNEWNIETRKLLFRLQTILGFLGLLTLGISIWTSVTPKEGVIQNAIVDRLSIVEKSATGLREDVTRLSGVSSELHKLSERVATAEQGEDAIQNAIVDRLSIVENTVRSLCSNLDRLSNRQSLCSAIPK